MSFSIHRPYPGVALVVTDTGSVLLGAPADAFKATKQYCQTHNLPFPRVLVAPQRLIVDANPQFAPEFFLYDFLFVYGQAFKPDLANERLQLVCDVDQVNEERAALWMTLNGPSKAELESYTDASGKQILSADHIRQLANVSEHLAIKKGDVPRTLDDMIETPTFDGKGSIEVLDGRLRLTRSGPSAFTVRLGKQVEEVDLTIDERVVPFSLLPVPKEPQRPLSFGVKALGTRSGFDLSGPTTGFLVWVNGRAIIYDGPVGTRYLLERQGITFSDVDAVVLSHCHEDHMGGFVELIMAGHRPKVYTAEPIYQSLLVKLAHHFHLPVDEVAPFVDYHRVTPGEPLDAFGATFDFFYTVHAIPTIGMTVSVRSPAGTVHRAQISGDTMHHEGLDKMQAAGVIDASVYERMRHLVPDKKVADAVYLADVGEAIIHGHPKDWQDNPNRLLYYHCPDNEHTRSFGRELAVPGTCYPLIDAPRLHPALPGRLLHALRFLELDDPAWLANMLFRGRVRRREAGEVLAAAQDAAHTFSIIVTGTAQVRDADGNVVATLRPGEFFGLVELEQGGARQPATVVAETPVELFDIDAALFDEYVQAKGLAETVEHVWANRPMVESAKIFRSIDMAVRHQIARVAEEECWSADEVIIAQGSVGDDFYLLTAGEVAIDIDGREVRRIGHADSDNFFGELAALSSNRTRSATVVAKGDVRTLRVSGKELRRLFSGEMGVRYALVLATQERGGKADLPR